MVALEEIAGPHVRAACKRHLDDLKRSEDPTWPYVFDLAKARHVLEFFPDWLRVEGEGGVIPFVLMPCWEFVVGSLFGWVEKATGYRRFREAFIEGGKGSAKTPLAAGIGLYMMVFDKELSAEVYAAGAKREQSMILFKDVVTNVERSPGLARRLQKQGKNPVWQLTHRPSNSIFRPLSADKKKSGARVSCGLIDELHEHKDRYTIDMLKAGFKGRKQPLLFVITNSGFDRDSVCYERHEHGVAVVAGLRTDDRFFAYIMALDDADDPLEDESCWPKTNPGLGITITWDYLRDRVQEARNIPGREGEVLRLNFCVWTDAEQAWMTRATWVGIEEQLVDSMNEGAAVAPMFEGADVYLGLDLSFRFDLTALALVFPEEDQLLAWIEYFMPAERVAAAEKTDSKPYRQWIDEGLIHAVPGPVVRNEFIAARLAQIADRYRVRFAAFDRYRHKTLDDEMAELGVDLPWIEHPQGFRRGGQLPFPQFRGKDGKPLDNPLWMPQSVELVETRILEKTLHVQPSKVTRYQVSSVVIRPDPAGTGNRIFDKRKSVGRIDGMAALAMGVGAADMKLESLDLSGFLRNPVRVQ